MTHDTVSQATVALAAVTPFVRLMAAERPELMGQGSARMDQLLQSWDLSISQLAANPLQRVPHELVVEMMELFVEDLGDPSAPLRAGEFLQRGDYQLLEYLCASCDTMRDSTATLSEYYPLLIDARYELFERDGVAEIRFSFPDELAVLPAMIEFALASNARMAMLHIEAEYLQLPIEVRFRHPQPDHADVFERVFFCPVRFGCEHDSTVFNASMLDAPMRDADPVLHMVLRDYADQQMSALPLLSAFPRRVREVITSGLPQEAALAQTASAMGLSASALRARLRHHGLTYTVLRESVRKELAGKLLRDPEWNISQIAYRLGFAHPPALHRACMRWFGKSPSSYRSSLDRHPASPFQDATPAADTSDAAG